jgi:cryptochrome
MRYTAAVDRMARGSARTIPSRFAAVRIQVGPRSQGLRMHDSPALEDAADGACALFPVFCLDPWFIKSGNVGPHRISFLLESLADLDASLRKAGSRLVVLEGKPTEVLPAVVKAWGAGKVCWEKDTEPYALERDAAVKKAVEGDGATVRAMA